MGTSQKQFSINALQKPSSVFQQKVNSVAIVNLALTLVISTIANNANALTAVDLKDDRKAKSTGFDLIYEARDLELPQDVRDGLTQARSSVDETKNVWLNSRNVSPLKYHLILKKPIGLKLKSL